MEQKECARPLADLQNFGKFRIVDKPERERQDARANGKEIEIRRRGKEELVVKFVEAAKQNEEIDDGEQEVQQFKPHQIIVVDVHHNSVRPHFVFRKTASCILVE